MVWVELVRVTRVVRRSGWSCICVVAKRIPADFMLVRRFLLSVSVYWVTNMVTLLLMNLMMPLKVVMHPVALFET